MGIEIFTIGVSVCMAKCTSMPDCKMIHYYQRSLSCKILWREQEPFGENYGILLWTKPKNDYKVDGCEEKSYSRVLKLKSGQTKCVKAFGSDGPPFDINDADCPKGTQACPKKGACKEPGQPCSLYECKNNTWINRTALDEYFPCNTSPFMEIRLIVRLRYSYHGNVFIRIYPTNAHLRMASRFEANFDEIGRMTQKIPLGEILKNKEFPIIMQITHTYVRVVVNTSTLLVKRPNMTLPLSMDANGDMDFLLCKLINSY